MQVSRAVGHGAGLVKMAQGSRSRPCACIERKDAETDVTHIRSRHAAALPTSTGRRVCGGETRPTRVCKVPGNWSSGWMQQCVAWVL